MRLRVSFILINIICILLTIGVVSYNFFKGLKTGEEIYLASYSISYDNENFKTRFMECCQLNEIKLNSKLDEAQIDYPYELHTIIERLDDLQTYLSKNLIDSKIQSSKIITIENKLSNLIKLQGEMLENFTLYKIKLSGNISGDPVGSYEVFINDILDYIVEYSSEISILNDYCLNILDKTNQAEHDIIDIYLRGANFIANNFSDSHFKKNSYETIRNLNTRIIIINSNIDTNGTLAGGLYSIESKNFCESYKNINKDEFIANYYSLTTCSIDIDNETDEQKIVFYYFDKLVRT